MVVAIEKGLEGIKSELESRGYEVFYIGENRIADAILYKEADSHPYYEVNNVPSAVSGTIGGKAAYGALLVNVSNKSIEDILRILDKRVYSPLI